MTRTAPPTPAARAQHPPCADDRDDPRTVHEPRVTLPNRNKSLVCGFSPPTAVAGTVHTHVPFAGGIARARASGALLVRAGGGRSHLSGDGSHHPCSGQVCRDHLQRVQGAAKINQQEKSTPAKRDYNGKLLAQPSTAAAPLLPPPLPVPPALPQLEAQAAIQASAAPGPGAPPLAPLAPLQAEGEAHPAAAAPAAALPGS